LGSGGSLVEFSDGQDLVYLCAEVMPRQLEHVDRGLACVDVAARVMNHLDKFTDRRNIDLFHLLLHHPGRDPRHTRYAAQAGGHAWPHRCRHAQSRVAHRGDLDVIHLPFNDRVQTEEGEKQVCFNALHARPVGHDQPWKQGNVSKQLGTLYDARLVKRNREGNFIRYAIGDEMIFQLCDLACHKIQSDALARVASLQGLSR